MGSGLGSPFGLDDKDPLNLLDVYFGRIYTLSTSPQYKKLEVWTQYRLLLSLLVAKGDL